MILSMRIKVNIMNNFSDKESDKNTPTYLWHKICIVLCSAYLILFAGFWILSLVSAFNNDLGLLLSSYLTFPYFIGLIILPLPATIFGIYALKYAQRHYDDFEDDSKTYILDIICIAMLVIVVPTALFYCSAFLRM